MKIPPWFLLSSLLLAACTTQPGPTTPRGHLSSERSGGEPSSKAKIIPAPVRQTLSPPPPRPAIKRETFSVVANNLPIQDLLFVLARDARLNVDIHPGVSGNVTLNAIDQTVAQILARIARQLELRIEFDGPNLSLLPDTPFLRQYKVDYLNLQRQHTATVSSSTQIAAATPGTSSPANGNLGSNSNHSSNRIENSSRNQFWESLERNIKDILRESDKLLPEGSSETQVEQNAMQQASGSAALPLGKGHGKPQQVAGALQQNPLPTSASQSSGNTLVRRNTFREAASVILNPESGIIAVRASQRQHERIREFIDQVVNAARRQVLIEATIVEVALNDGYEQGIDWRQLSAGGLVELIGNTLRTGVNLRYTRDDNPNALISLLASYGNARVLSSPRLSVLNNQAALLKVVENYVYFSVKADAVTTANVGTTTTYSTTPQTVPVGLVLGVTPQIGDSDEIILNIRPTITSVGREIPDPNPDLRKNGIENLVPVIRTREIDSVMRISNGQIAILGGLMEDGSEHQQRRIPLLGDVPVAGELFTNRHQQRRKTELVILLRPVIIRDASLDGDYAMLRDQLSPIDLRPVLEGQP